MTKKFTLISILVIAIVLYSGLAFAQSKQIFQEVWDVGGEEYPDNDPEGDGVITFRAWIEARPDVYLTDNSPGCGVGMDGGNFYAQVNVGNFVADPPWAEGEVLHIEVYREATEHFAHNSFELTRGSAPMIMRRGEVEDNSITLRDLPTALFDSNLFEDGQWVHQVATSATFVEGFNPNEDGIYKAHRWEVDSCYNIRFSTDGFDELSLSAVLRRQYETDIFDNPVVAGPRVITTEYSIDGEEWVPYGNPQEAGDIVFWMLPNSDAEVPINLELPEAVEDQETVWFRWRLSMDVGIVEDGFLEIKDVAVTGYGEDPGPSPNPTVASHPAPEHQATDVSVDLERIAWRYIADEDYTDPVGFRVYFDDTDEFGEDYDWVAYVPDQENYAIDVPVNLNHETRYYWEVIPTTTDGGDGRRSSRTTRNAVSRDVSNVRTSRTRATRNSAEREVLNVRSDDPVRELRARDAFGRTNAAQNYRGDAQNTPVWYFTTEDDPGVDRFALTIRVEGRGTTHPLLPDSTYYFEEGDDIVVTALPDAGHEFLIWRIYHEEQEVDTYETPRIDDEMPAADITAIAYFQILDDTEDQYAREPANPNEDYNVGDAGNEVAIFSPADDEDTAMSMRAVSSSNPDIDPVQRFSNPGVLGRFYRFIVDQGGVFRGGRTLKLRFDQEPNELWISVGGGGWSRIDADHWNWDAPFAVVDIPSLGLGQRSDIFDFAGDDGEEGSTLPVELSSFTANIATVSGTAQMFVRLQWVSETETNMQGYRVHRNTENSLADSDIITPSIIPATNTSETTRYQFEDLEVNSGNTYYYWLESIDNDLTNSFHGPVSVTLEEEEEEVPEVYVTKLMQNYPNPFNPNTTISFEIERETQVSLEIYNVLGQKVKTLVNEVMEAGNYPIEWNGTDDNGQPVTSGIYFYRLSTDFFNDFRKMMLVK